MERNYEELDGFKKQRDTRDDSLMRLICCLVTCLCIICCAYVTLLVFVGIYAYKNPDPTDCWYLAGMQVGMASEEAALADMPQDLGEPVNVHAVYTGWFTWLFWTLMVPVFGLATMITMTGIEVDARKIDCVGLIYACATCLSFIAVFVVGSIWRFSGMSKACTRDVFKALEVP